MSTQMPEKSPEAPTADKRGVYLDRIKAELDRLNSRIDEFEAKAVQVKADAEIGYYNKIDELTAKRKTLQHRWEELNSASESAWQDVQRGFESAWHELTQSFESATKHFKQ